jgi:hypothetical protein
MSTPESRDWSRRVFDQVDVHASDHADTVRFYETVLTPLGIPRLAEGEGWTCFANLKVAGRQPPTRGFHRAGVEAGFRSNGEPGYRDFAPGYYAAYLLDPEGNNVEALYRDEGTSGTARVPRCADHSTRLVAVTTEASSPSCWAPVSS